MIWKWVCLILLSAMPLFAYETPPPSGLPRMDEVRFYYSLREDPVYLFQSILELRHELQDHTFNRDAMLLMSEYLYTWAYTQQMSFVERRSQFNAGRNYALLAMLTHPEAVQNQNLPALDFITNYYFLSVKTWKRWRYYGLVERELAVIAKTNPTDPAVYTTEYLLYRTLPFRLFPAKRERALVSLKRAVELDPSYGRAYYWKLAHEVSAFLMPTQESVFLRVPAARRLDRELDNLEALYPNDPDVLYFHALLYYASPRWYACYNLPLAHKTVLTAIQMDPNQPRYYMLLAMIQNREGDAKTALTTIRKVLAMPEMPKRRLEQLAERKQASDLMAEFQKK